MSKCASIGRFLVLIDKGEEKTNSRDVPVGVKK